MEFKHWFNNLHQYKESGLTFTLEIYSDMVALEVENTNDYPSWTMYKNSFASVEEAKRVAKALRDNGSYRRNCYEFHTSGEEVIFGGDAAEINLEGLEYPVALVDLEDGRVQVQIVLDGGNKPLATFRERKKAEHFLCLIQLSLFALS
jgi:hypothetical protein